MVVLQYFGMNDLLAPLKDMVTKFAEAIPNIIAAGVIAYAGWIIAKVFSQLVKTILHKVDSQIAEKTANTDLKISAFGSDFICIVVLLPISVATLGALKIPAISEPASAMIQELWAYYRCGSYYSCCIFCGQICYLSIDNIARRFEC